VHAWVFTGQRRDSCEWSAWILRLRMKQRSQLPRRSKCLRPTHESSFGVTADVQGTINLVVPKNFVVDVIEAEDNPGHESIR
jgi:hypothetical protein